MELSEEENKAIEMLNKFITEHKLFNIKQLDNLEENIKIVLNLILKLQIKIESKTKTIKLAIDRHNKQAEEIENLKEDNLYLLAKGNMDAYYKLKRDCISRVKIERKIEDLNKQNTEWTDELSEPDYDFKIIDMNLKRIKNQIDILQELESEE